jgi:NADPH2:quinone reductase
MKAIQVQEFGAPSVLRLVELPDPTPGPGQVLVRIRAAGVNPVETYIRSGAYARKPALPYTPGSDGAGTIEVVGDGVSGVSAGDRVYTAGSVSGTYAELAICEAGQVHPLPDRASFSQGAAVNIPYATAYRSLFQRAHAGAGETVLVHGATGGVGIAAVQLARAHGLRVIGTGGTERGREQVLREGAHHALDHRDPAYLEQLMALTGGRGVDLIMEMLANVNLSKDLSVLAQGGRVVVIGCRGPIEINPRDAMVRDAAILGMVLMNGSEPEIRGIHAGLVAGLENGSLRPLIGTELPLSDAPRAHEQVMEPGAFGKIVLVP